MKVLLVVGIIALVGIVSFFKWPTGVTGATARESCLVPEDGMHITASMRFCTGTYSLPRGLHITGKEITVDCSQSVLQGRGEGTGITLDGSDILVKDCHITDYAAGALLEGEGNLLENVQFSAVALFILLTSV